MRRWHHDRNTRKGVVTVGKPIGKDGEEEVIILEPLDVPVTEPSVPDREPVPA